MGLVLIGTLRAPYPDDPSEMGVVQWVQARNAMIDAAARIEELEAANDAAEKSYRISDNGNMWRFWSDKARELAHRNAELSKMLKETQMDRDEIVRNFGSASNLAKALGITRQAVSRWKGRVPDLRAYQIREIMANNTLHEEKE